MLSGWWWYCGGWCCLGGGGTVGVVLSGRVQCCLGEAVLSGRGSAV